MLPARLSCTAMFIRHCEHGALACRLARSNLYSNPFLFRNRLLLRPPHFLSKAHRNDCEDYLKNLTNFIPDKLNSFHL